MRSSAGARTDRPRLLTVLHAAERTGPPLFALQFLRWLHENDAAWRFSTLFLDEGGPLVEEFEQLGPVTLAEGRIGHEIATRRGSAGASSPRSLRKELERSGPIAVSHVHCAGSFRAVPALPAAPILGHLHELSVGQDLHLGPAARQHLGAADRYVAVSSDVRTEFVDRFGIDRALVDVQWGFVDPARLRRAPAREELGLPPDALIVTSSGVRHWRKAPELFVRVAMAARRSAPDVPWRFIWIGGADVGGLEAAVAEAGLEGTISFLPHQPEALDWLLASDLFLLTAREDAFPLVCVEAAAAGLPVLTFDNGGAAELVERAGCGAVAPPLDVEALALLLVEAARDPDRRARWSERGRRFAAQHLLIDVAGPKLRRSLLDTVAGIP